MIRHLRVPYFFAFLRKTGNIQLFKNDVTAERCRTQLLAKCEYALQWLTS